jgi:MFS family permease
VTDSAAPIKRQIQVMRAEPGDYAVESATRALGTARSELRDNWLLLVAAVLGGLPYAVPAYVTGVFLPIWEAAFGWSRSQIGIALSAYVLCLAIGAPIVGRLIDRWGVRIPVMSSLVLLPAGFFLISRAGPEPWSLAVAYAVFALISSGSLPTAYLRSISERFNANRGLAFGIAITGTSIAAFFGPPIAYGLLEHMGWRGAWIWMGALPLLVLPLVFIGLKEIRLSASSAPAMSSAVPGVSGVPFRDAVRTLRFWRLVGSFFLTTFAIYGIVSQLIPILISKGVSTRGAVFAQSAMAVGLCASRILGGYLIDRISARVVYQAMCAIAIGACMVLVTDHVEAGIVAAILFGVLQGAEYDLLAYLNSRYFGLKEYGQIYGLQYGLALSGALLAPISMGYFYDVPHTYTLGILLAAGVLSVAIVSVYRLGPYPVFENVHSRP